MSEALKDLGLNATAEGFIKKIKKEKTKKAVPDNKEKPRLQKANKPDQKGDADEDEEEEDWTHAKRKTPPTSEDLDDLMEKDTPTHKEKMNKIHLGSKATSTVPMDFNVAMAADFEDCLEVPNAREFSFCNCNPKKKTVQLRVNKKTKHEGRLFLRCPDWNKPDNCKLFVWVDEIIS